MATSKIYSLSDATFAVYYVAVIINRLGAGSRNEFPESLYIFVNMKI